MYICEFCKTQPATIHLTDIHNNVKKEIHLCEACAEKKGMNLQDGLSLSEVLKTISKKVPKSRRRKTQTGPSCNNCGITWAEFQKNGRLGCPQDYLMFRENLVSLISDIHAHASAHAGKHPTTDQAASTVRRDILSCRRELRDAISNEHYEEAAKLRDHLSELEEKATNA